jgi:hypothetical protein
MSFLRPEAMAVFRRWREPLVMTVLALVGLLAFRQGSIRADAALQFLGLLIAVPFAIGILPAVRMARLRRDDLAPGLVEISERQITYMGPRFGGSVSLNALTRIEIVTTADGPWRPDVFWTLFHSEGPALSIPSNAQGAEALPGAFSALPGFDLQAVMQAMSATGSGTFRVWQTKQ